MTKPRLIETEKLLGCRDQDLSRPGNFMDVETETSRDWAKDVNTKTPSRLSLLANIWLCSVPTLIVHPIKKICVVSPPPSKCFFCAVSPPVPLPHSVLSLILSRNIMCGAPPQFSSVHLPIHTDTWPQLKYQSSSTCISECGTPS